MISVSNNRITIWNIKTKQIVSIIDNITIIEKVATFQIDENKILLGCSQHLYVINIEMCRVHEINQEIMNEYINFGEFKFTRLRNGYILCRVNNNINTMEMIIYETLTEQIYIMVLKQDFPTLTMTNCFVGDYEKIFVFGMQKKKKL